MIATRNVATNISSEVSFLAVQKANPPRFGSNALQNFVDKRPVAVDRQHFSVRLITVDLQVVTQILNIGLMLVITGAQVHDHRALPQVPRDGV